MRDRLKSRLASEEDLEQAMTERRVAKEQLEICRNELAILGEGAGTEELQEAAARTEEARQARLLKNGYRAEDRRAAGAASASAEAAVKIIEARLAELTIRARKEPGGSPAMIVRHHDARYPALGLCLFAERAVRADLYATFVFSATYVMEIRRGVVLRAADY